MEETAVLIGMGAVAAALSLQALRRRLELSRAKHPSLTGHARMARRIAALIPYYAYDEERFFCSDGAPAEVVADRRAGFARLAAIYRQRFARSAALTADCDRCSSAAAAVTCWRAAMARKISSWRSVIIDRIDDIERNVRLDLSRRDRHRLPP